MRIGGAFEQVQTPPGFYAVGECYRSFAQIEDEEAVHILKRAVARNQSPSPKASFDEQSRRP